MKNVAFLMAVAVLVLAVPVSAAETSTDAPASALELQIEGPVPPLDMARPAPIPFCSDVQGTSCTTVGAKRSCTDVCHSQLSCTCTYFYSNPSVRFWHCQQEC